MTVRQWCDRWTCLLCVLAMTVASPVAGATCADLERIETTLRHQLTEFDEWTEVRDPAAVGLMLDEAVHQALRVDAVDFPASCMGRVGMPVVNTITSELERRIDAFNRSWEEAHFELLAEYEQGRNGGHRLAGLLTENEALERAVEQARNRIQMIDELTQQSIEGSAQSAVVVGKARWDGSRAITEFRKDLVAGMGEYAARSVCGSLMSRASRVAADTVERREVTEISGGRVESYEGDAFCVANLRDHTCVHMFRCFPDFSASAFELDRRIGEFGAAGSLPLAAVGEVGNVASAALPDSMIMATATGASRVADMLDRVAASNRTNTDRLATLTGRLHRERARAAQDLARIQQRVAENREQLDSTCHELLDKGIGGPDRECGRVTLTATSTWIDAKRAEIEAFVRQRDYLTYTVVGEQLQGGQSIEEILSALTRDATARLDQRKRQFLSRKIVRVVDGDLVDVDADDFYVSREMNAFSLPAFFVTYPSADSDQQGGSQVHASLILAARMVFAQGSERNREVVDCTAPAADGPRFVPCVRQGLVADSQLGLLWAVGRVLDSRLASAGTLLAADLASLGATGDRGWRFPSRDEIRSLGGWLVSLKLPSGLYWTADSSDSSSLGVDPATGSEQHLSLAFDRAHVLLVTELK